MKAHFPRRVFQPMRWRRGGWFVRRHLFGRQGRRRHRFQSDVLVLRWCSAAVCAASAYHPELMRWRSVVCRIEAVDPNGDLDDSKNTLRSLFLFAETSGFATKRGLSET